ncbi:putative U2 auxiliary factor small subunit [Helianthus annuus]|nr:putative U2 auxiliary factor small subunit [Helianthus annuus]
MVVDPVLAGFRLTKNSLELRRQLFGRSRRKRSRSRSHSPQKHRGYDERGSRGSGRRGDCDHHNSDRDRGSRRLRSRRSPPRRGGRSRSPGAKRNQSPVREGSVEKMAKIGQWNQEREQADSRPKAANDENNDGPAATSPNGDQYYDPRQQRDEEGYDN